MLPRGVTDAQPQQAFDLFLGAGACNPVDLLPFVQEAREIASVLTESRDAVADSFPSQTKQVLGESAQGGNPGRDDILDWEQLGRRQEPPRDSPTKSDPRALSGTARPADAMPADRGGREYGFP